MANDKKTEIERKISTLEAEMAKPDFWADKTKAQAVIKEIADLRAEFLGGGKYDSLGAIMTIFSGAGGDDAEDFTKLLFKMYVKYIEGKNWAWKLLTQNENDHGGFRNITIEIVGKNIYGTLNNESGVHRLVRLSPFNAKNLRQTSFSLVEVVPKLEKQDDFKIPENELRFETSRAGGPGGQNVNKRETAVRAVHIPTGLAVASESERSQAQNKEKALEILRGKLFKRAEEEKAKREKGLYISKTTDIEWGNQIRSYVMHPYKMVKDHRTDFETSNIDAVLNGEIEGFLEAERELQE